MPTTDELVAIVAGSLAGFIVLIITISIILYCIFGKRKKRGTGSKKIKLYSPPESQPSALPPGVVDPRLPKVGSNGLWMGAPSSMYASGPAQAYYMEQRPRHGMQKWSSETRLQGPQGHMVYDGNSRIYHSNLQMPMHPEGLHNARKPGYDGPVPYAYHFKEPGTSHSRTVLVQYPNHGEYYYPVVNQDFTRDNRVRRSQSDVTSRSTKKSRHAKRRNDSSDRKHKDPTTTAEVYTGHRRGEPPSPAPKPQHGGSSSYLRKSSSHHNNISPQRSYEDQSKTISMPDTVFSPSATDSAKLRAVGSRVDSKIHRNITDDDKDITVPEEIISNKYQNETRVPHYEFQSDVYAVPDKSKSSSRKYDKSVVTSIDDIPSAETQHSPYSRQLSASINVGDYRAHNPVGERKSSEYRITSRTVADDVDAPNRKPRGSRTESVDFEKQGKSVTTEAFGFLESYLSDEETDNMDSEKHTPLHGHVNRGADIGF